MKRLGLSLCLVVVCLAQTPAPGTPPAAVSVYYRLPNQAIGPYPYKWMTIDPPLTFRLDKDGTPHLGIDLSGVANCKVVDSGVLCSSSVTSTGNVSLMRGDIPVRATTGLGFTLKHVPLNGVSCYRNGMRQIAQFDYQLAGAGLTATNWEPGNSLVCDYEYIQ